MKLKTLLFLPITCALLPIAHADTVYNSAAAFAAATSSPNLTTFGTTSYSGGFTTVALSGGTYTTGSVSFTPANFTLNLDNASYYNTNGGSPTYPNGNYAIAAGGSSGVNDVLTIGFPSSTAFAISIGGDFAPGETFTYSLSDGFSGSYTSTGYVTSGSSLDFLGFTSNTPITSITISSAEAGNPASYDNIIYATALTPEPSSLYLLGTSLVGGLITLRRRFNLSRSR